jgi:hypothetical protein
MVVLHDRFSKSTTSWPVDRCELANSGRRPDARRAGRGDVGELLTHLRDHGCHDVTVRYALDRGYDVILEGILAAARYEPMLAGLARDHAGTTAHYYFDVPLEETLRRHATRPLARKVTPDMIRDWYIPRDLLGYTAERVIPESSSLQNTIQRIMTELNWTVGAPIAHTLEREADSSLHR